MFAAGGPPRRRSHAGAEAADRPASQVATAAERGGDGLCGRLEVSEGMRKGRERTYRSGFAGWGPPRRSSCVGAGSSRGSAA